LVTLPCKKLSVKRRVLCLFFYTVVIVRTLFFCADGAFPTFRHHFLSGKNPATQMRVAKTHGNFPLNLSRVAPEIPNKPEVAGKSFIL
jgi:hypothetical protein